MKTRLLGAAVLIALAVIFVPMLLPSKSSSGTKSLSVKVPPEPSGVMQTRVLKVGPNGASAGSSTAVAATDPDRVALLNLDNGKARQPSLVTSAPPASTSNVENAPKAPAASAPSPKAAAENSAPPHAATTSSAAPASSTKSQPVTSAKPEPKPVAGGAGAAAETAWSVNLGIYADAAGAHRLVAKAKQHGFTAAATPEAFQGKRALRVRVGPFASRAAAEAARLKLKGFVHVPSTVEATTTNQTQNAPASALPAGKAGGWAVQLAAFRSHNQANMLRDRLRNAGFDGFVDSVKTSKGTLWRVRAGPYTSRDAATTALGRIDGKLKVKGIVVTNH